MKVRLRVQRVAHVFATPPLPEHVDVALGAIAAEEAPEFVSVGQNPGHRYTSASLTLANLEAAVAGQFQPGADYLLTLEPIARR